MAISINDGISDQGSTYKSLVYREGVKVKYPDKDGEIVFGILPAFGGTGGHSWVPYRDNTEAFTPWAVACSLYPFVNKTTSIISPKTFDRNAFDPIEELIKTAKGSDKWRIVAGFGPDGKKVQDSYKNPEVRIPSMQMTFVVNALIRYDKDFQEDKPSLLQIPSTAFRGQPTKKGEKPGAWGLIYQLNRRNRGAKDDDTCEAKYYWGDVTNPTNMLPMILSQQKAPTGGSIKIYNVDILDENDEDVFKASKETLEARHDLDAVFHEITTPEIIDFLVANFCDLPDMLMAAFSHKVPGFKKTMEKAMEQFGGGSGEEDDDEIPMDFTPKTRRKEASIEVETPKRRRHAEEEEVEKKTTARPSKEAPTYDDDTTKNEKPASRSFAPAMEHHGDDPGPEGDQGVDGIKEEEDEEVVPVRVPKRKVSARSLVDDD